MHKKHNGILGRLGLTDAALERAREADAVLDELCNDLEQVDGAFAKESNASDSDKAVNPPDHDLVRLTTELESEIRQRLRTPTIFDAPFRDSGRGSGN